MRKNRAKLAREADISVKVMVIQEDGEARKKLVQFLEAGGAEVVAVRPTWPGFFLEAKKERPDVIVVDCSPDPGYGRECAGYLGENGYTNRTPVLAINVSPNDLDRLKRRAPKARVVHDLERELMSIDPEFGSSGS